MFVPSGDEMQRVLAALDEVGRASANVRTFAEAVVTALPRVVPSDTITLSIRDLRAERRREVRRRLSFAPTAVDGVLAVPLYADDHHLVSVVLERTGRAFDEREAALLEMLRGPLSSFYRLSLLLRNTRAISAEEEVDEVADDPILDRSLGRLTRREEEVLGWLRAGKTNREIAVILGISARTVEKHLEHLLAKAGAENRTAAVLRLSR